MNKKLNKKVTHQNTYFENDEIDFFGIIETLLKFKLRIIVVSIIASILGSYLYFSNPKSYEIRAEITPPKSSVFSKYFKLNRNIELSENYYSPKEKEKEKEESEFKLVSDQMTITNLNIFQNIIDEFNDYEEVKEILNQQKTIDKNNLSELDKFEKLKFINNKSKNFEILNPTNESENFIISVLWHDPDQGSEIFNEIINLVLQNVQSSLVNNVNQIPEYLKLLKKNKINLLEKEIFSILNLQKIIDNQRILHLTQQAELARTVGLQKTLVTKDDKVEILADDLVEFAYKNSSTDYLRGFEVLDKERELLQNRTNEELLLSNNKYPYLKNEIDLLLNDDFADQILKDIVTIKNDNPYHWVNYDLGRATIKKIHKSIYFYVLYSFLLGLTLSSIFTLFYHAFQNRKFN